MAGSAVIARRGLGKTLRGLERVQATRTVLQTNSIPRRPRKMGTTDVIKINYESKDKNHNK